MMNIKRSILAATISAGLSMGIAAPAAANVYGLSSLSVADLVITIRDGNGVVITPSATNFSFSLANTATLNGSGDFTFASCNQATCPGGPPVLYAGPANAPGGTAVRAPFAGAAPATMALLGPGADQYSTSDSQIRLAQLTGAPASEAHQIAESELQTGASATANAEIRSTTGFVFTFTIPNPGPYSLDLSLTADPDLRALIGATEKFGSSASANLNASFTLAQQVGGAGFANFAPRGTLSLVEGDAGDDCIQGGGVVCTETADAEDLNINVATGTPGTTEDHSYGPAIPGFGLFGATFTGLSAGTWTFTLNALTSVELQRVPEPGVLALLGIGLAGIGIASRRRKLAA